MAEKSVDTYIKNGNEFVEQDNFDKAIVEYTKALKIDPNLYEAKNGLFVAHFNRGMYHYRNYEENGASEEIDKAIEDVTKAIHYEPDNVQAYGARGSLLNIKHDYDGVIRDFSEAIRLEPTAVSYSARGSAYYGKSRKYLGNDDDKYYKYFEFAIKDWKEAVKLDPSDELTQKQLKNSITELELRKGIDDFQKTLGN